MLRLRRESSGRPHLLRITKVWARNFKSLRVFDLDLAPLTVLVGPNGSGKSNIIDILSFIYDAFYDSVRDAISYRDGPISILHMPRSGRRRQFSLGLRASNEALVAEYQFTVGIGTNESVRISEESINLRLGDKDRCIVVRNGKFVEPRLQVPIRDVLKQLPERQRMRATETPVLSLIGDQPSFAATITAWLFSNDSAEDKAAIASGVSELGELLGEMRFYRISPDDIRRPQPISLKDSLEEDGTNLASVLRSMRKEHADSYQRVIQALHRVAPEIVGVEPRTVGGMRFLRLMHSHPSNPEEQWPLDFTQESDGTARALALLVAVEQKPAPAVLAIEEPELGIHTGALSVIADLLKGTSRDSQVLISTHSSDLLDFVPEDAIRAVALRDGETVAGSIADHQKASILEELMTPGYVNRVEGLELHESASGVEADQ